LERAVFVMMKKPPLPTHRQRPQSLTGNGIGINFRQG